MQIGLLLAAISKSFEIDDNQEDNLERGMAKFEKLQEIQAKFHRSREGNDDVGHGLLA